MAARVTGAGAAANGRPAARQSKPPGARQRRPPAPTVQPDGDDDLVMDPRVHGFEPVRLPAPAGEPAGEIRVPLFYIGDRAYTIPAEPGMEVGLEALHIARLAVQKGFDADTAESLAMDYVFDVILGTDGYTALRGYQQLPPKEFTRITAIAYRLTMGAMELPKGSASG